MTDEKTDAALISDPTPTPTATVPTDDTQARMLALLDGYESRLAAMQKTMDEQKAAFERQLAAVQAQAEANARAQGAPYVGPTTPPVWYKPETHRVELLDAIQRNHDQPMGSEQPLAGDYTAAYCVRGLYICDPDGQVLYLPGRWEHLEKLSA